jgi:ABC-type nitrate/sulfonate/bicarbonate transport system substrate-binding protein
MLGFRHLAASLVAVCAIAGPASADTEQATLALPAIASIFTSLYVAQDAGIYKEVGLEVKEQVIQGIGSANAVIAGSIDFSSSSGVTLTRASARQQPVIGIANTYNRLGFWIVIKKSIADERHFDPKAPLAERAKLMKGLRFAVGGIQAIPDSYAKAIAKIGGLDPDKDIVRAGITPQETFGSMQAGAIDGASIGPPVVEQLLQNNFAVVLANGTMGNPVDPPWLSHIDANVILVRKQTCTDRRSLCQKMGQAMVKAAAYVHQHADETKKILAKRLNIADADVLQKTYEVTVAATPLAPVLDAKALETADQLNVEAGFLPADDKLKSYDHIFTNEFVK